MREIYNTVYQNILCKLYHRKKIGIEMIDVLFGMSVAYIKTKWEIAPVSNQSFIIKANRGPHRCHVSQTWAILRWGFSIGEGL